MQHNEAVVAARLLTQVDQGGYLLADGNYDTNPLHEAAGQRGYQLLTKDCRPHSGRGHRQQSSWRLRGLHLRHTSFGQKLLTYRSQIERDFAPATSVTCGLNPRPAWVRRKRRVRTWVWSKFLINATRILVHPHHNQQFMT